MKKLLTGILMCTSLVSYSYADNISAEVNSLSKAEQRQQEKNNKRREKLLAEITQLESEYNFREVTVEKLRMDSEVSWKRDEYSEILKKYETLQKNTEKEIVKRQKEVAQIEKGFGIISAGVME